MSEFKPYISIGVTKDGPAYKIDEEIVNLNTGEMIDFLHVALRAIDMASAMHTKAVSDFYRKWRTGETQASHRDGQPSEA